MTISTEGLRLVCVVGARPNFMKIAQIIRALGLGSFDRAMPEEINRILTDQLADLLFTTERSAAANLEREGIARGHLRFLGNVRIDKLFPRSGAGMFCNGIAVHE